MKKDLSTDECLSLSNQILINNFGEEAIRRIKILDEFLMSDGVCLEENCKYLGKMPRNPPKEIFHGHEPQKLEDDEPSHHAVTIIGIVIDSENNEFWEIRNSWGDLWSNGGYRRIRKGLGLSGALETLCSQGFGAKQYRML
ncbi:hypothetical protein GH714_018964 [Hevea brasiliensis]|nr:hypothetical protein GH714_018964 [Hevea brasiliensis]